MLVSKFYSIIFPMVNKQNNSYVRQHCQCKLAPSCRVSILLSISQQNRLHERSNNPGFLRSQSTNLNNCCHIRSRNNREQRLFQEPMIIPTINFKHLTKSQTQVVRLMPQRSRVSIFNKTPRFLAQFSVAQFDSTNNFQLMNNFSELIIII